MILELLIGIIIGSTLIGIGVYFIPVGGAPAALSTSAGVPTGAPMITVSMGITGILASAMFVGQPEIVMILSGAVAAMTMISMVMLFSNIIHVYGVGVPIASENIGKDPITGYSQEEYVSPGTKGHGIPTISFISGVIGALIGGLGGSLSFSSLYSFLSANMNLQTNLTTSIAAVLAVVLFYIMAVVSSYNISGTIQGFYDKKFKEKIVQGIISCLIISAVLSVIYTIIVWGLCHV